jgi:hypothetical protein
MKMKLSSEEIIQLSNLIDRCDREDLSVISAAVADRSRVLKNQQTRVAVATLKPGDTVRLVNIKPKYLNGTRAEIVRRSGNKFLIRFEDGVDRRAIVRFGKEALCPATTLEKV